MIDVVLLFYQLLGFAKAICRPLMGRESHSPVDVNHIPFYYFDQCHWKPHTKVGSKDAAECISGIWNRIFLFLRVTCYLTLPRPLWEIFNMSVTKCTQITIVVWRCAMCIFLKLCSFIKGTVHLCKVFFLNV